MKRINSIFTLLFIIVIISTGCKSHFEDWKDFNENYLDELSSDESLGFKTSDSELRYQELFQGLGPKPKSASLVKIKYSAHLVDGSVCTPFDTVTYVYSYPTGLQEALLQMNQESVWKLAIPYNLAFGEEGTKNSYGNYIIPPYTTIYVDWLELVWTVNY